MAKYEKSLNGDFDSFLSWLDEEIRSGSLSSSFEDGSDITIGDSRVAVRVYERYSMLGGNRVSLNITLVGHGGELYLSAITSGGSQAVLFKINTLGEESFLDTLIRSVERYISEGR
jgi:hypothetical protein